jgi:hypothetical protein
VDHRNRPPIGIFSAPLLNLESGNGFLVVDASLRFLPSEDDATDDEDDEDDDDVLLASFFLLR